MRVILWEALHILCNPMSLFLCPCSSHTPSYSNLAHLLSGVNKTASLASTARLVRQWGTKFARVRSVFFSPLRGFRLHFPSAPSPAYVVDVVDVDRRFLGSELTNLATHLYSVAPCVTITTRIKLNAANVCKERWLQPASITNAGRLWCTSHARRVSSRLSKVLPHVPLNLHNSHEREKQSHQHKKHNEITHKDVVRRHIARCKAGDK